jgi:diguanylate cyclase (GGDEF)-like protein
MNTSKRSGQYAALMFLDLDNFKPLNDTHGHDVGDLLLVEVANRITSIVRKNDTVARFGGDEYVVILSELNNDLRKSTELANNIAEKIRTVIAKPYLLPVQHERKADAIVEHNCTSSIGVVMFIDHEVAEEDILKWADLAMYQAKNDGRNLIRFYE